LPAESVHFDTAALETALVEKTARLKLNCEVEELRLAHEVAERARQLVAPHHLTGETEEAIHVEHGDGGAEVHFKNHFLEFGTSRQKAAPFARPAIAEAPGKLHPPDFH
jgi:hypothetical protein